MVARLHAGHVVAHASTTRALVAQHDWPIHREAPDAVHDVQVAVADAGRDGADQHLAAQRRVDVDRLDGQGLVGLPENRRLHLHAVLLEGTR